MTWERNSKLEEGCRVELASPVVCSDQSRELLRHPFTAMVAATWSLMDSMTKDPGRAMG